MCIRDRSAFVGKLSKSYYAEKPVNTLDNALLEIKAGLHRATLDFRSLNEQGRDKYLQGKNWDRFWGQSGEFIN